MEQNSFHTPVQVRWQPVDSFEFDVWQTSALQEHNYYLSPILFREFVTHFLPNRNVFRKNWSINRSAGEAGARGESTDIESPRHSLLACTWFCVFSLSLSLPAVTDWRCFGAIVCRTIFSLSVQKWSASFSSAQPNQFESSSIFHSIADAVRASSGNGFRRMRNIRTLN